MADLTQTLLAAARGDTAAAARLEEEAKNNYPEIVKALISEIAAERAIAIKQTAALFLKNTLNAKSPSIQYEMHERWKRMDPNIRKAAKETLMVALRGQETDLPRFAAIAASEIACVELPYHEWPTFVQSMTEAISSPETPDSVKIASLDCLGITCERIEEVQSMLPDVPDLPEETVNSILTAIVQGIQSDRTDAQRFSALQALYKSLNFVHKNMEVKSERDFIMNSFGVATQSGDPRVRRLAFNCLDTVAELYYTCLADYMTQIYEITSSAIRNDTHEEVQVAAIEFWITVAATEESMLEEEERLRVEGRNGPAECKKYVESATGNFVPLLLETLSKHGDDTDEDTYDLRAAGSCCLESFALTVGSQIVHVVLPFVQLHITSEEWRLRDAALVAFFSILDGPSTTVLGQYVQQIVPVLLRAFSDSNVIVQDSAVHCISNICKLHMQAVQPDHVHAIIQGLIMKLQESPKLADSACSAIFFMSASMKDPEGMPESNLLSRPMLALMQALIATMDRPDAEERNLRVGAMSAAGELITASALDVQPVLRDLLPAIVGRVEQALQMESISPDDRKNKEQMLGLLCGLITALYQKLSKQDLLPQTNRVIRVIGMILQVQNASCHEEAFLAIGAIAIALEDDFRDYLAAVMPPVLYGLRSVQAHQLCIVAVGTAADLCAAVGNRIQPFCDEIMQAMTDCLKDGSAHRDTKPVVFSCFGDIAMAIGEAFQPYLQVATVLLMQASQAQIQLDDEDLVEFINRLRLSILEAYTGIIIGLSDGNVLHLFAPIVDNVMQFLGYLSTMESCKDEMCLQKAVALLGDICQQMGQLEQCRPRIRQQMHQPFVSHLVQEAAASTDSQTREIAHWTQGVVQQLISS